MGNAGTGDGGASEGGTGDGGTSGGVTVGVACGGGGRWTAPVAINDAKPTTMTTAPSDNSDLSRLVPLLIIDARPKGGDCSVF